MTIIEEQVKKLFDNPLFFSKNQPKARVKFSMAVANLLLTDCDKPPSPEVPIVIDGGNILELKYLWTALMVFGTKHPKMSFKCNAIVVNSTSFSGENELGGFWSTFSKTSLYETVFKHHLTNDMLELSNNPEIFEGISNKVYKTVDEQIAAKLEEEHQKEEEIKRQEEARIREEDRTREEARKLEEDRKREEAKTREEAKKREDDRKREEVRIREKANKLEADRKQEEIRKREETNKLEADRKQEEIRKQQEANKLEADRKQEEIRKREEANKLEADRKQEEIRKQQEAKKLEEDRKQEEIRKQEKAKRQEEARMSDETIEIRRQEEIVKLLEPIKEHCAKKLNQTVENSMINEQRIQQTAYNERITKHQEALGKVERKNANKNQQKSVALISTINNTSFEHTVCILNVAEYLKQGADIDYKDSQGRTALIHALSRHYDIIAEYLLNNGANPLLQDMNGVKASDLVSQSSPLYELIKKKENEEREIAFHSKLSSEPPFSYNLSEKATESFKLLEIKKLNQQLLEVIKSYPTNTIQIRNLLLQGADIDYRDNDGQTALMAVVETQNDRIVEYLLKQGANPLVQNFLGEIASDLAPRNSSIYTLLKKREREVRLEALLPHEKYSILLQDYVCGSDVKAQKIDEYLALGADINYQNFDAATALMFVVDGQNDRIAEHLLKNGANPFLKNKHGKTAKNLVSRHSAIFQILKGYEFLFAVTEGDLPTIHALLNA